MDSKFFTIFSEERKGIIFEDTKKMTKEKGSSEQTLSGSSSNSLVDNSFDCADFTDPNYFEKVHNLNITNVYKSISIPSKTKSQFSDNSYQVSTKFQNAIDSLCLIRNKRDI